MKFISSPFLYLHDSRFLINSTIKFRICLIFPSSFVSSFFLPSFLLSFPLLFLLLSPTEKLIGIVRYPRSRSTRDDKPGKNYDSRSKKNARDWNEENREQNTTLLIHDRNEDSICFVLPSCSRGRIELYRSIAISNGIENRYRKKRSYFPFLPSFLYMYIYIAELRTTMRGK